MGYEQDMMNEAFLADDEGRATKEHKRLLALVNKALFSSDDDESETEFESADTTDYAAMPDAEFEAILNGFVAPEAGVDDEQADTTDYGSMPDEEFEAVLDSVS